jgi:hypothetical protein
VEGVVGGGAVHVDLDAPLEMARWRPLVQWVLAIPHLVVLGALHTLLSAFVLVAFITVLFTGRIPESVYGMMTMVLRYQWRVYSYAGFLRDGYPPFTFSTSLDDPDDDQAVLDVTPPGELARWAPLYKWLLAIPNAIALCFVGIAGGFVWSLAFVVVLLTGRFPGGMRDFLVGVNRWSLRLTAYVYLMTDEYPPFSVR